MGPSSDLSITYENAGEGDCNDNEEYGRTNGGWWERIKELLRREGDAKHLGDVVWLTSEGKEAFELYLQKLLFGCAPEFLESEMGLDGEERFSRYAVSPGM